MHSLTRSCFCFRRLLLKSACKARLHYSRQLGSFFLPPRRSWTRFSRTPMAHNGGPAQVAGWCDDCYELVNLSLSYDSNLCINYQAKSSSTEIQVKATIS